MNCVSIIARLPLEWGSGRVYGDKGYILQVLSDELAVEEITLVKNIRNNMKIKDFYL
ncbi:hypothetical protein B5C26_19875 [Photorhabdus luminescens]|nr:transposase [Photorhabdus luminescens]OWO79771.1 hypothetical protein B5C26_19875 [Photorhabdus luminescens]